MALGRYEASFCPCGCGHPYAETTSPEEGGPQYVASRIVCRARLSIIEQQLAAEDPKKPNPRAAARLWRADKKLR